MIQPFPNGTLLSEIEIRVANKSAFLRSSRNPNIDLLVQPGPYKELLPCDDLCYNIVQSCPAAMGFSCPRPNQGAFNQSYGVMPDGTPEQSGQITCNYPGAAFDLSSIGSSISMQYTIMFVALAVMTLMLV
jgi:calcium channel MID1